MAETGKQDDSIGCGCSAMIIGIALIYAIINYYVPSLNFFIKVISALVILFAFVWGIATIGDVLEKKNALKRDEALRWEAEAERRRRENKAFFAEAKKMSHHEIRFLRYLFTMLAKLAKADGRVDEAEVRTAEKVFECFEFAQRRKRFCCSTFNKAMNTVETIYWYAEQFQKEVSEPEVSIFVYELLWDVACADGWLHPAEKEILLNICDYLHVPRVYFSINYRRRKASFIEGDKRDANRKSEDNGKKAKDWRHQYVSGRSSIVVAYEILESEPTATVEELQSAYRRVAKRYHPDSLRANGVPEEMIAEANKRMAQVNAAWADIRKARGI